MVGIRQFRVPRGAGNDEGIICLAHMADHHEIG
jgi:hypothetical protein